MSNRYKHEKPKQDIPKNAETINNQHSFNLQENISLYDKDTLRIIKENPKSNDLSKGVQSVGPGHADDISRCVRRTLKGTGSVRERKQILEDQVGITEAGKVQRVRRDRHPVDTGKGYIKVKANFKQNFI